MVRTFTMTAAVMMLSLFCGAQHAGKIEMYRYMANDVPSFLQPSGHFRSSKGWYAEMRYNYEDAQTLSLYGGKNFSGGKDLEYSLTPMIGYSAGKFNGISLAGNIDLDWKGFYFSSQSQASRSVDEREDDFLFTWSELGYSITRHFFAGISTQFTRQAGENLTEAGMLAGLSLGNLEIPLYMFSPFSKSRNFILGVSYEFDLSGKN